MENDIHIKREAVEEPKMMKQGIIYPERKYLCCERCGKLVTKKELYEVETASSSMIGKHMGWKETKKWCVDCVDGHNKLIHPEEE